MSLKVKLTSTICAFFLILGLVITGVFAVPQATVNLGGTLTFKATDVYARVTGTISGSASDPILQPIEFNASSAEEPVNWTNDLVFKSTGDTITISINVENLATDRPIYVSIKDTLGNVTNLDKTLTNGTFDIDGGEDATATITLGIHDKNLSLSGARYGYTVELYDESAVPETTEVENMDFTCDTTKATASIANCGSATGDIVIPSFVKQGDTICEVTEIADYAFAGAGITSITIPDTVTKIGEYAFPGSALKSVKFPKYMASIGEGAFQQCEMLTSINIPEGITSLPYGLFYQCVMLEYVKLPEGLTKIGSSAFVECTSLENVIIPNSVNIIGESAFSECSALTKVYFTGSESEWNALASTLQGTDNDYLLNADIEFDYKG